MKRLFAAIVILMAVGLIVAACGGDPTATPRPATSAPTPTPIDTGAIVQQAVQEALSQAEKQLEEATAAAAKAREADAAAAQAAVAKAMTAAEKAAAEAQKAAVAEALAAAEKRLADAETAAAKARADAAAAAAATAAATAAAAAAAPFDAAAYFKGKTIRVVVAWDPGNSIDAHGRAVSRFLPRHIPGNPKSIVLNKDGAKGTVGGNWWHDNSKPDGLWLFANTGANPINQLLRDGIRYDFREYTSVGGIMQRTTMWMAHEDSPYARIQDAVGKSDEFTIALNTQADPATAKALAIAKWLDLPMRPLYGIGSGFADYLTTMDRKDAHTYISGSAWYRTPGSRPGWMASGRVTPFMMLGPKKVFANNGEIDVPADLKHISEVLTKEQADLYTGMSLDDTSFYRGLFTRKDTKPEILTVLRKAFQDMLADPEYQKVYKSLVGLPVSEGGTLLPEEVNAQLKIWEANASEIKATYDQFLP